MMRRPLFAHLPLLVALLLVATGSGGPAGALDSLNDPLVPPTTGGVERADRLLAKLTGHRRLLVIGAHPDDEDTTLIAYVSRALGGEAAYLSLTRGEGGQNLIGPELGVGLGLLRSRELLAARGIDGGRQYFTRAYDFGYTRSLAETLERWPRQALLEDAVRVIRRFRPQVVVSIFPPDERGGHGQHQAAGVVAGEAYELAGDPQAFPELAAEGLAPWQPAALYRAAWWRPEEATLELPLGTLEGVSGRSIFQIAMDSRSQHRCQDMGRLQPLGPYTGRVAWERGAGGGEDAVPGELFAGVDTRLAAITEPLPEAMRAEVGERLARAEELAHQARSELTAVDMGRVLPLAAAIHRELTAALEAMEAGRFRSVEELIEEKRAVAAELLATVAGIGLDATADRERLVAGSAARVETTVWNAAGSGVELLDVRLDSPQDLTIETASPEEDEAFESRFRDDEVSGYFQRAFRVGVPPGTAPTVPYFLRTPRDGDLYDWSAAPPGLRGEPFAPPPLHASFRLRVAGEEVRLRREVVYSYGDQALGEVRRGLRVAPALEVTVARDLLVWPTDRDEPRTLEVTLTSHAGVPVAGRVEASTPAGWRPATASFRLPAANSSSTVRLELRPAGPLAPGEYPIEVVATADCARAADGEAETTGAAGAASPCAARGRYDAAVPVVDYPHVRATPYPQPADVRVVALDLTLPAIDRIGYVRGAADRVPEALTDVGLPVELLAPAELATRDLSRFDAVVIGARAFEVSPALGDANPALLDYARGGGLVIVQYQQYDYSDGGYAPHALEISRPHGRVTDETAPVTVLAPDSPVLTTPNAIGAADWRGWVQERGLYMPSTWGEPFRPLLEMADPGEEPQRGALLVAPVGEGTYVYTGLAFFRQLPAGVPGAYRLFANLLGLAETRDEAATDAELKRPASVPAGTDGRHGSRPLQAVEGSERS